MSRRNYSDAEVEFINNNYKGTPIKELVKMFNEEFGSNRTYAQLKGFLGNKKWRRGPLKDKYKKYQPKHIDFIREHINKKYTIEETAELFSKHFEMNVSTSALSNVMYKNNIKAVVNRGAFQKGQISFNKGLKQTDFMSPEAIERTKATRFKKGNRPQNYRPIGSERITVDGFVEVKVADPNKWRHKQRVVWEKHNGKIPKNHVIIVLDGNKQNCVIENLAMITREQHAYLNKNGLRYEDAELTEVGINITKVMTKTHQIKRGD